MSNNVFGYSREAVRVKVKKCEGTQPPELRKFSVDPQITSFEVLQSILAKAFDLKGDFAICYRVYDVNGHETYMPLLSDWDLDAAFIKAYNMSAATNSEPCLCLRVDLKPFEECSDDWEMKQNVSLITQIRTPISQEAAKPSPRLHGIFNQMGKTLNMVQRVLNLGDDCNSSTLLQPPRPPLSDSEFRKFLDPVGQIVYAKELRSVVYFGGIDPSLRKVVWKHLLNVYPDGMTGRERMDYIKKKAAEYMNLRDTWKSAIAHGPVVGELAYTTGMVRKDVLRTDRHHPFYAGSDDNQNIAGLFNILTTYALNHPKVSYCQGMSDLASPLLVTMNDEAHAYICFCALMQRLCTNFMIDGIAMTQKFTHLAEGLMYYDAEFYNYLKMHQADDLLFCYRWLLLEMKREFAFEDSLRMLEVLWSSLPADPPTYELKLYDVQFQSIPINSTPPISPLIKTPRENAYTKVCALRRQSSSISLSNYAAKKIDTVKRQNHSLDETISKCRNSNFDIKFKHQSLDDAVVLTTQQSQQQQQQQKVDFSNNESVNNKSDLLLSKSQNYHQKSPTDLRPRSVSPLDQKSDSILFSNRIHHNSNNNIKLLNKSKSTSLSSSMSKLIKNSKKSGHFKELKDRVAAAKLFSSLDRLDLTHNSIIIKEEYCENNATTTTPKKSSNNKTKLVKNLNEFLNFIPMNNHHHDESSIVTKPMILLTKSSFDDATSEESRYDSINNKSSQQSIENDDDTFDEYSPDDSQEYFPLTTSVTRELRLELENLDRKVFGEKFNVIERLSESPPSSSDCNSSSCCIITSSNGDIKTELVDDLQEQFDLLHKHQHIITTGDNNKNDIVVDKRKSKTSDDIFIWENPLHQTSPNLINSNKAIVLNNSNHQQQQLQTTPDEQIDIDYDIEMPSLVNETSARKTVTPIKIIHNNTSTGSNNKELFVNSRNQKKCRIDEVNDDDDNIIDDVVDFATRKIDDCNLINGDLISTPGVRTTLLTNSCEEMTENVRTSSLPLPLLLPPPNEFGGGNPFLMFLCITVLLQHRDHIIDIGMDYNEMAMHFDKMVRKHNVTRVLNQARQMYARYIKQHTIAQQKLLQDSKHEDC